MYSLEISQEFSKIVPPLNPHWLSTTESLQVTASRRHCHHYKALVAGHHPSWPYGMEVTHLFTVAAGLMVVT